MMKSKLVFTLIIMGFCNTTVAANWEALPDHPPIPADNPQSEAKIELGKVLYFDPRLSSTGTLACASCHNVMAGGEDNRPHSIGVENQRGGRSSPTVWNAAFQSVQFWDGRAVSLEEQARGPVTNPIEMGMKDWESVVKLLKEIPDYEKMFEAAFGEKDMINSDNVVKAIAAYERTLITPRSSYDKYVKGEKTALNERQIKGMNAFSELGCVGCHSGVNFSGPAMEMGKGFFMKFPTYPGSSYDTKYELMKDKGRYEATKKEADMHMWRVPTLRNITLTAPYFHNGSVLTLDEAVRVMGRVQLNKDLSDEQVEDIVAFLNALTGEFPQQTMPRLPGTLGKSVVVEKSK